MGLTPAKTKRRTAAPPAPTDQHQVDDLRRAWLAQLPADIDTIKTYTESSDEAVALAWNVAGCARQFMEWTHFNPGSWQAPAWYPERLGRICTWLQQQDRTQLAHRREDALQILLTAWTQYHALLKHPTLLYDVIPSLYTPEDLGEFGPLDMPLPYLPHWRVTLTPEQEADLGPEETEARRAAAHTGEEFTLYAGLTTWLNTQIGQPLLDLTPNPF